MLPYQFLQDYSPEQLKKFHGHISENIRRANSKKGWLRHMLPVWTQGKMYAERIMGIESKSEVIKVMK